MKKIKFLLSEILLRVEFLYFYWYSYIQVEPYSKEVDDIMKLLLKKYDFELIDSREAVAKLGDVEIWIANIPYGCMCLYNTELEHYRPSRLTILRGLKKLKKVKVIGHKARVIEHKKQADLFKKNNGLC